MRRLILLSFWLLLIPLAIGFGVAVASADEEQATPGLTAAPPSPAAQVAETSFDFGVVREGRDYIHDFKIKNTGTAELQIRKVLPS